MSLSHWVRYHWDDHKIFELIENSWHSIKNDFDLPGAIRDYQLAQIPGVILITGNFQIFLMIFFD